MSQELKKAMTTALGQVQTRVIRSEILAVFIDGFVGGVRMSSEPSA